MPEPLYPLIALSRLRMGSDGEGVTTLIAGAGCPLSCRWCLNAAVLKSAKPEAVSAEELIARVRIDDLYFRATGGGVCFGGGEALLHAAFLFRFRERCPAEWRITAETSLSVPQEQVILAADAVDSFIVDCKDMNEEIYRRYTGGEAALMKRNLLLLLDAVGPERVLVRVPRIPSFNTSADQEASAAALRELGVSRLELFDYIIPEGAKGKG